MTGFPPNDENDTSKGNGILIAGFYDDIVFRAIIVDDGTVIQNLWSDLYEREK